MKKTDRELIFNKCGGRCAYCGCELNGKWCADHIEPVYRLRKLVGGYRHKITGEFANNDIKVTDTFFDDYEHHTYKSVPNGSQYPERDNIENLFPTCFSCNHYKSTFGIEIFRKQIGLLVGRLNKSFNQYKIAKRYGLIIENIKPVIFYFEKLNQ